MVPDSCLTNCIADSGRIEKPPPGNRISSFIQRLKIYSDVQKSFFQLNQS